MFVQIKIFFDNTDGARMGVYCNSRKK